MSGYTVYFVRGDTAGEPDPTADDTVMIEPDDVIEPSFPRTHTSVDEWSMQVPLTESLDDWRMSEMYAEYEASDGTAELIYRGRLDTVKHDHGVGLTTLRGECAGYRQKHGSAQVTYSSIAVHDAIADFWTRTPYSATVVEPTPETVAEGKVVSSASTTSEFDSAFNLAATDPVVAVNGELRRAQSAFRIEAENPDSQFETTVVTNDEWSGGEGVKMASSFSEVRLDFNLDYKIPSEEVQIYFRYDSRNNANHQPFIIEIDGNEVVSGSNGSLTEQLGWRNFIYGSNSLSAGSHTCTFRIDDANFDSSYDPFYLDMLYVVDRRFNYNVDNTVHEAGGYLDGPELYPAPWSVETALHEDDWNVTDASIATTFDDVSGGQALEASNDDGSTWDVSGANVENVSGAFDSIGSLVRGRVTLDGYGSRNTATPRYDFNGQSMSSWELAIDTNDLAIFNQREFVGSHQEIIEELHEEANYRWVSDFAYDSLNVESFPRDDVVKSADWTALEGVQRGFETRGYRNVITCYGAYDKTTGEYIAVEARADSEVQRFLDMGWSQEEAEIEGTVHEPELDNEDDVRQRARQELNERVAEDDEAGTVPIVPKSIAPGYSYTVDELGGQTLPLESVEFQDGEDPKGALKFEDPLDITTVVRNVSKDVRRTKRAIR